MLYFWAFALTFLTTYGVIQVVNNHVHVNPQRSGLNDLLALLWTSSVFTLALVCLVLLVQEATGA